MRELCLVAILAGCGDDAPDRPDGRPDAGPRDARIDAWVFPDGRADATPVDGPDPDGPAPDAPATDGAASDARADAAIADAAPTLDAAALGPFGPPVLVASLSGSSFDYHPTFTDDFLEVFFVSDRTGGSGNGDLWRATRLDVDDPFEAPTNVTVLNTAATETAPAISGDGRTIWFASNRTGGPGMIDVYTAVRDDRDSPFGTPTVVAELSTAEHDYTASVSPDARRMSLTLWRGGEIDVWWSTRDSASAPWGTPVRDEDLGTTAQEGSAWAGSPALTYFARDGDLFFAVGDGLGGWTGVTEASELNSSGAESCPFLTPDLRTIYFCSNRNGTYDIFMATR